MNTISIAAVGDLSLSGDFINDFRGKIISDDIKGALHSEIIIGNLECVVSPVGEVYDSDNLLLKSDETIIGILKEIGFNVLSLANNHIYDAGSEGLLNTIRLLDSHNIKHCGAGANIENAIAPAIFRNKGISVGIFSCISAEYFCGNNNIASQNTPGLAPLDVSTLELINQEYSQSLDYKILCVHWGLQDVHYPSPLEVEMSRLIIDSGFNLVLGHHPHIVQGTGDYKNGKIAFSLGNFYFHPIFHAGEYVYGRGKKYRKNRKSIILKGNISHEHGDISHDYSTIPTFQGIDDIVQGNNSMLYKLFLKYLNFIAFSPVGKYLFRISYFWDLNKNIFFNIPNKIKEEGISHYLRGDIFSRMYNKIKSLKSVNDDLQRMRDN